MKQAIDALFPVITGIDGLPLDGGKVYIGEYGFDPLAYPKSAFWDEEMTIPAVQPIVTVSGYLTRNGAAARVYVDGGYSMAVHNANDEVVMSDLTVTSLASAYQPLDAALTGISDLSPVSSGKMLYTDASGVWAASAITAAGRDVIGAADASAQRAALGLGAAATAGFLDEDDFASDSATAAPSQQSTKAFVNSTKSSIINQVIGVGQTWQDVSRTAGTNYQNTTGRPIMVAISGVGGYTRLSVGATTASLVQIAYNNAPGIGQNEQYHISAIIPNGHYYQVNGSFASFAELR